MNVLRPIDSSRGWTVLPIHYSHDEEKDAAWVRKQRKAYTRDADWNREMELDFTEVVGTRAYPQFRREVHVSRETLLYNQFLPLCLCCDFNVGIMVWPIVQIIRGKPHVIDEVTLNPANIPDMVRLFRDRFPAHPGELWIYGDASGSARTSQTTQSDYDLMRMAFRGYSAPITFKVPASNPPVKDRLNSVSNRLVSQDGEPGIIIDAQCKELIADFVEVVLRDGGGVLKTNDPSDRYSMRTHASDAFGYMIVREWPLTTEVWKFVPQGRRKIRPTYGKIPGRL